MADAPAQFSVVLVMIVTSLKCCSLIDGKFHMLPTGELLVMNVVNSDSYSTYQCRVTHRLSGSTKMSDGSARITVTDPHGSTPPRFSDRVLTIEARRDELVILPCYAEGYPAPDYRWEINGIPVTEDDQRYSSNGLLIFPRARPSDSARYVCTATNSAGNARIEISLLITAPLSARVTPSILTATLGTPAQFTCTTAGHPVNSIVWMKNGVPVSGMHSSGPGETFQLSTVSREDQGMYQCLVKNEHDMAQGTAELRLGDTPPQIIYRFIRQTIQPGPSVSLKCVASGNPTPVIKWTLDGFALPSNDRFVIGQHSQIHGDVISHVNITSVHIEDGGTYKCTAINRVGQDSHSAQLNVYGAPHIRPMNEISAIAGETLRITCPVAGYPIEEVKWYKGDRLLPINRRHLVFKDNYTLVIDKIQSSVDDGHYRCVALNKQGKSDSGVAKVKVIVPPKITPFTFRSDLHLGERVGVQCVVSKGDPPLSVQWLKNGQELGQLDSEGIVIRNLDQFTSVLSIGSLAHSHGGNYTCEARNAAALATYTAPLSVNVPPAITPFSFGELSAGERVRVTCSIKRGDRPISISWYKDDNPLHPQRLHDDLELTIQDVEEYSSVLAIRSVSSRHSGNYTCVARNPARTATYTARLLVTVPPTWVKEPRNAAAKLGEQVMLDCKVSGFPQPTIFWKKGSDEKPGQYQDLVNHQSRPKYGTAVLMPNGSLVLESVTQEDEGNYLCEASNGIGVGLSGVVHLAVHAPVHFKVRSRKELVRKGGTATLTCAALGDQPIIVRWRKEGGVLDIKGRMSISNISTSESVQSELKIVPVQNEDGGVYTCFARNEFGQDQTAIHLVVQDAPSPPANLRVLDRSSRQISVAWTPAEDGNSPITRYIVRYHSIQDSWQGPMNEIAVEGIQSSATLTVLRPATLYSIRLLAENIVGPSSASQELRTRTDDEAPSAPPVHITVEATSSTALQLSWDPPPPDQWNGQLLGHYVGHREMCKDMEGSIQYNFTTVPLKGSGKEEVQLNSLRKFCKYGLVIQAFNSRGPGPLSVEVVAQTLEDVPEAPPRDITCTSKTSESLDIQWQPPPENQVHGHIQGYRIQYEPVLEYTLPDFSEPRTKMTISLASTLHGLSKYTNYSIEISAFTRVGDGTKSARIYCHTQEDVPGQPAKIKAVLQESDTAILAWMPPAQPNGKIIRYNIYIRVLDGGRQVDTRAVNHHSTSDLFYTLPGLKRRLVYEFRISAFTKVGEGQISSVATLTPASKVKASIISFDSVILASWKSDVRLPCRAVGTPELKRQWRHADSVVGQQPRLHIAQDGTLLLNTIQRADQGEYACIVWNDHGRDRITYTLHVQVPPGTPLLVMTGNTQHSLQLQWKLTDDGGSPVRGFILHYKMEHGEWEEIRVESTRTTYTLGNLRCGSLYHVYITSFNRVGNGSPSKTLDVRTRGGIPVLPSSSDIIHANITSVSLRLDMWPSGGCPLLYFVVEYTAYSPENHDDMITGGNNIAPSREFILTGLSSATTYKLRITAHNAAGSVVGNYHFTTLSSIGGTVSPSHVLPSNDGKLSFYKNMKIILISVSAAVLVILFMLAICVCIRKRRTTSPPANTPEVHVTATQENKNNIARREQFYATVRKVPVSPAALECIPEYAEDIRPYATFHVPGPANIESTKLQTFVYRENDMSPSRKSIKNEYCRVKKIHPNDEYDSFGSESDTEPGTSSRTESSNQLDDGHHGDFGRTYHPPLCRQSKSVIESVYQSPEWNSPIESSPSVDRRHYRRRYCQAHHVK